MKGIIFNITTPFDVYFFLNLKKYALESYNLKTVCIITRSKQMAGLTIFLDQISEIKIYVDAQDCRYFNPNIFKNSLAVIRLSNECKKYKNYILITTDKSTLISNVILSRVKESILLQYPISLSPSLKINYALTLYCNFFCHILKINKVIVNKYTEDEIEHQISLKKNVSNLLYIEETSEGDFLSIPFEKKAKGEEIVIFGSRFLDWKFSTPKMVKEVVDCFEKLKARFPYAGYQYIPHPRESNKEVALLQSIFNNEMIVMEANVPAELLLQQIKNNKFCISIGSTASKQAYLRGFKSYVLYKMLFTKDIVDIFDSVHSFLPKEYFLTDMLDIDKDYQRCESGDGDFEAFHRIMLKYNAVKTVMGR